MTISGDGLWTVPWTTPWGGIVTTDAGIDGGSLAPLGASEGNLVFTGTEDDPETLKTLTKLGFKDPSAVAAAVRGWHHGRYRATRSARARELLTELMPSLLVALGRTANPDPAFHNFDEFLKALPAGVQLFSLLHANPVFPTKSGLLDLLAEIRDRVGVRPLAR